MGLIKKLHHVSMRCNNDLKYAEEIHFYKDILGLSVVRTWEDGIMFDAGGGIIEVFRSGADPSDTGCIRHYAFEVDDVDACAKVVRDAGYEVFKEPQYFTITSHPELPARIAFCKGPLGEEIEFFKDCTEEKKMVKKHKGLSSMEECLLNEVLDAYYHEK